jgi:hypothetical protein
MALSGMITKSALLLIIVFIIAYVIHHLCRQGG